MGIESKTTVQKGKEIYNTLLTDFESTSVKMYLISDFMHQLEYIFGLTGHIDIEKVFDVGSNYINGIRIEP